MSQPLNRVSRVIACAVLFAATLPLAVLAAPPDTTPTPAAPAPPAATQATQAMSAAKGAMLSDSARAAVKSQVTRDLKQMADTLKLTPEQRERARPILLDHAYNLKQVRDKYVNMERTPANREAMTKEVQAQRDATDGKLSAVLNPDQLTHYKAWRDAGLAKMRAKMSPSEPAKAMAPADTMKK